MPRTLIIIGVIFIVIGFLWPWIQKLNLGRLPGDIFIQKDNVSFYFPLVTSIVVSLVITLLFWFFRK